MHIYKDLTNRRKRYMHVASDTALFMQQRRRRAVQPTDSEEPGDDMDYRSDEKPIKAGEEQKQSSPIVPPKSEAASKLESASSAATAPKVEPEANVADPKNAPVPAKTGDTASSPVASGTQPVVPNAAIATGVLGADSDAEASLAAPSAPAAPLSSNSNNDNAIKTNNDNKNNNDSNNNNVNNEPEVAAPVLPVDDSSSNSHESNWFRQSQEELCRNFTMPLIKKTIDGTNYYNFTFSMFVATQHDEGLYNLYFHACPNYDTPKMLSFNVG